MTTPTQTCDLCGNIFVLTFGLSLFGYEFTNLMLETPEWELVRRDIIGMRTLAKIHQRFSTSLKVHMGVIGLMIATLAANGRYSR